MDNKNGGETRKFDTAALNDAAANGTNPKHAKNSKKKKSRPRARASGVAGIILNAVLTLVLIGIITGVIVVSVFAIYIKDNLIEDYDIVGLETNLEQTTKIYYIDKATGTPVEVEDQRLHGDENRSWVSIAKMPVNLKNAFVAIEDQRFYEHNGMDIRRTAGAVLEFIGGNSSYGGSTITQQLIKNFSGDNDATIQRKIKEIFRAISLTKKRSRDEVLEMYLNTINLSNGCYGVQAAANYLFGKDVSELTLVECASLASIPKSPYKYNPKSHPDENKERRETVLGKMKELGWISEEDYNEAMSTELVLNITEQKMSEAGVNNVTSYFTDALIEQIIEDLNKEYGYPREVALNIIFNGGLKIHTTMDPEIQGIMEDVYTDPSTFAEAEGIQPESAMVVMDPYTGDVKGIVGGRGEKTVSRGLNRATMSKRQIGSAIKPLTVYAPAMDLGYIDYGTVIDDTPYEYNEKTGKYWPENAGRDYRGKTTVWYAINQSLNTTAVKALEMLTPEYSYYFGKEKLGLVSLERSDCDMSPLALGGLTYGLTVMEVAGAYTILPNEGVRSAPRLYTVIYDNNGDVLLEQKIDQTVAISRSTSQIMTKILETVVVSGTGAKVTLEKKVDTAGKTGSTNSNKDLYFVGYTPYYVGACWFGYDQPKYISGATYPTNPAMLAWDKVMNRIHDKVIEEEKQNGNSLKKFSDDEIVKAEYCADSGKKPTEFCRSFDPRGSRVETGWFKKGAEPRETCDKHEIVEFCGETGAVASEYCPKEGRKQFALVNVDDREYFISNIYVQDTQYTCRTLPRKFTPILDATLPYYSGAVPEGAYAGRSKWVDYPFNRLCLVHTEPPKRDEPEIDEENGDENINSPDDNNSEAGIDADNKKENESKSEGSKTDSGKTDTGTHPGTDENDSEENERGGTSAADTDGGKNESDSENSASDER